MIDIGELFKYKKPVNFYRQAQHQPLNQATTIRNPAKSPFTFIGHDSRTNQTNNFQDYRHGNHSGVNPTDPANSLPRPTALDNCAALPRAIPER